MNVLVLNCGSSSLKFQIICTDSEKMSMNNDDTLAKGIIERIGSQALIRLEAGAKTTKTALPLRNHREAIDFVLKWAVSKDSGINGINSLGDFSAAGHRVVHGGESFSNSALIDETVLKRIEDCIELAPLHNPSNLQGIYAVQELLGPGLPQAAVFDTAFHSGMSEEAFLYALPYQYYRRYKVRKYGFHGTSHRYISYRYRHLNSLPREKVNIITLHLGNGASACAIKNGQSIDTSMGMTPLEGMVMGTRCGDIDPAILDFIATKEGLSFDALDTVLNKQSGLLGISGLTNDMRELQEEEKENGDRRARLAIDIFCRRVRKYLGAYLAEMNGTDAIVFSGGIGENSHESRRRICTNMEWLGVKLDPAANESMVSGKEGIISTVASRPAIWVIPTNEELLIARDTVRLLT